MAEPGTRAGRSEADRGRDDDDAERAIGRAVALGLPAVCAVAAIGAGAAAGLGSALLVLASGALVGAVALLWASVRTLSGDAPLSTRWEEVLVQERGASDLMEQKRRVLRSLKDLESEHALGKIDDADYEDVVLRYREEAKALLREIDRQATPARANAEKVAREYLAQKKLAPKGAEGSALRPQRLSCRVCKTSNEPDASFCKGCGSAITAKDRSDEKT